MQVVMSILVWEQLWLYSPAKPGRSLPLQVCVPLTSLQADLRGSRC